MAKRKYTKKNLAYWNNRTKPKVPEPKVQSDFEPQTSGEPFYVAKASVRSRNSDTAQRHNKAALSDTIARYSSIDALLSPFEETADGVGIVETIELCHKAYSGVAVFRNAVDIMAEFANTDLYLDGGTKKSRQFFEAWFKRVRMWNIKDQFFREYYRSGNIFLYRLDGQFDVQDYVGLVSVLNGINPRGNEVALKYILLNPKDIWARKSTSFSEGGYCKALSRFEIEALKNPKTDYDRKVRDSLNKDLLDSIDSSKGNATFNYVYLDLDPEKLSTAFYKKQDYEPFAIPFGYPVLEDINAKLELKKMDQAITRTVENVILLITMGAEPDKGGVNAKNLAAMQTLFENESVGRVLVSDYTTKADFVIPDLKKVLGPEKYTTLNEDIKQGLQNIVVGEEKYSSTQVKAEIFIERLKEARNAFLNDFLQPEIDRLAKNMGLKNPPEAKFKDIDMRDETQLMRVTTRLLELGIITPEQAMEMFHTGMFPKAEDIAPAQDEFIKRREDKYYNPIVGGLPLFKGVDQTTPKPAGEGASPNAGNGRPEGSVDIPLENSNATISRNAIAQIVGTTQALRNAVEDSMIDKLGELSEDHQELIDQLCESVICHTTPDKWVETAVSCVNDPENIADLSVLDGVSDMAIQHELEQYAAAILYHSYEN